MHARVHIVCVCVCVCVHSLRARMCVCACEIYTLPGFDMLLHKCCLYMLQPSLSVLMFKECSFYCNIY